MNTKIKLFRVTISKRATHTVVINIEVLNNIYNPA